MAQTEKSFNDHYKLSTQLGSGAFSQVFKCIELSTKKEYAAKIVSRNQPLPGSRNRELMFDVEIRINEKLHHENIVNLHEIYTVPKLTLIFDLVTGGELFDDIERRSCYSEADSAACIREVLSGVSYIHDQKVIHRDLKPENLLLTSTKRIKIADFGLAVEFNTEEDLIFGTAGSPDYIAPEILNKHYYNKKVDIWSCGVILYILLCGYPPFETREDQKTGQFKFYAEDWHGIDVEARTLIVRMLTVNQKQRITAEQALDSKWLKEYDRRNKSHRPKTIQKIKQFNAKRKFKGGVRAVMAANKMDNLIRGISANKSDQGSPNKNSVGAGTGSAASSTRNSATKNNNNQPSSSFNTNYGDSGIGSSSQQTANQSSSYNNSTTNQNSGAGGDHRSPESRSKGSSSKSPATSRSNNSSKDKKRKKWYQIF